jgi:indole-3-glycerol phosphate synthase
MAERPLEAVLQQLESAPMPPAFFDALVDTDDIAVIAEVKKASPSKGVIRADFDPVAIGQTYEGNGASAISVLTDEKYFQGSDTYLTQVSNVVDIPILRKDFVVDPYQIYEARAIGAAAVLLIASVLDHEELEEMIGLCGEVGLDALVEVHTEEEALVASEAGAEIVGINNRDLTTFETDLETTPRIARHLPEDVVVVSESGIHTRDDIIRLRDAGADAVLIGESLMREPDIGRKLRDLLGKDV